MRLSDADQVKYPRVVQYLRHEFPKLASVPSIVTNAETYGHLTYDELKDAIAWGTSPGVVVTDSPCGVPSAYGCIYSGRSGTIYVRTGIVEDFENRSPDRFDTTARGRSVFVLGVTLLHGLCHWGNLNNVPRVPEREEMGAAFEMATYGKLIW
jgi:hypothetical protein